MRLREKQSKLDVPIRPDATNPQGGPRPWMTTREAGDELGFADATVIKMAVELGGYRSSSHGPWRFPRARVEAYKGREAELRKPNATVQALAQQISDLTKLSIERENRQTYTIEKLERRIHQLEKQNGPQVLAA